MGNGDAAQGAVVTALHAGGEIIDIAQLAARWGVSEQTIYNQRHRNEGPPSMRIGRKIKYRLVDVLAWEEAQIAKAS